MLVKPTAAAPKCGLASLVLLPEKAPTPAFFTDTTFPKSLTRRSAAAASSMVTRIRVPPLSAANA
jgi:hypothetical protein